MEKDAEKITTSEKRAEIVRQAFQVFFRGGFHASGVDSLLEGTGISKRTLYKHFSSKEDLIRATVEQYQEDTYRSIVDFIESKKARAPEAKALLIFDWLENVLESGHVLGCYVMNAKIEYSGRDAEIERCCDVYAAKLESLVAGFIAEAGLKDAKKLAAQIVILFNGAIFMGRGKKDTAPALSAKRAAKALLDAAV